MKRRIQDGPVQAATRRLFCANYRLRLAFDGRAKSHQLSQPVAVSSSVNLVKLLLGKVPAMAEMALFRHLSDGSSSPAGPTNLIKVRHSAPPTAMARQGSLTPPGVYAMALR
jgi:hypothetical protein